MPLAATPDWWWKLNETSGSSALNSGAYGTPSHYNGTLTGFSGSYWLGASESWGAGGITGGLSFDGVDDFIAVANALPLGGLSKVTFSAWTTRLAVGDYPRIIQNGNGVSSGNAQYQISSWNQRYRQRVNGGTYLTDGTHWTTAKRHVVVVLDLSLSSDQIKVYFDGQRTPSLVYTTSVGSVINPNSDYPGILCIIGANQRDNPGGDANARTYYWPGKLCDIRIWRDAATPDEVEDIYNNQSLGIYQISLTESIVAGGLSSSKSNKEQFDDSFEFNALASDYFFCLQDGDENQFVDVSFFPEKLVTAEDMNRISSNIRVVRNSEVSSIAPINKNVGAFWMDISNTSSYRLRITDDKDQYVVAFSINPETHEPDYSVAIGGDKFENYTIKTSKIGSGQLQNVDFANNAFTSDKVTDNSHSRFAANAIGSGTIAVNAIGRNKITSGSVIRSNLHLSNASVSGNSSLVTIALNKHSLMPDFRASNTNMVLAGHASTPDPDNPKIRLSGQGMAYNYSVAWNYIVNS